MSFASVYTNIFGAPIVTNNIGSGTEISSTLANGGNLPISPATLVDGTTYNMISKPFPFGYGVYSVSVNFDWAGDNTTQLETIYLQLLIGGALAYDDTPFINVALTNTDAVSYSKAFILTYTNAYGDGTLQVRLQSQFSGTAIEVSSAYCDITKIN